MTSAAVVYIAWPNLRRFSNGRRSSMATGGPAMQLQGELRIAVQSALASRRPLLHHLNADSSWLLQLPRPEGAVRKNGRFYYNILIDPWLKGYQIDFAAWFSQQWHAKPSAIATIAEVEELSQEIELLASQAWTDVGKKSTKDQDLEYDKRETGLDLVIVSHEFTDHCHRETLLEVDPQVPVFAAKEAAQVISKWQHFRTVMTVNEVRDQDELDWRSTSLPPLPEWLGVCRLVQFKDTGNLHAAMLLTFNNGNAVAEAQVPFAHVLSRSGFGRHDSVLPEEGAEMAEAVIYTPHGIHHSELGVVERAKPPIHTLALLHGMQDVRLKALAGLTVLQINRGALNGSEARRRLQARYWIATHDEVKKGHGLIGVFLSHRPGTEEIANKAQTVGASDEGFTDSRCVDLGNGESFVLV